MESISVHATTLAVSKPSVQRQVLSWFRDVPIPAVVIMLVVIFAGLFGDLIMPHNPIKTNLSKALMPPFWEAGGNASYLLGTDHLGRDILSRLIGGARISMLVGFAVVFAAGSLGALFALLAGYFGGWIDTLIMRLADTLLSMPFLVVAVAIAGVLGPSLNNVILVLVVMGWAGYARVLRGEVLRIKESSFIRLAVVAGCSRWRILRRHIFPNIINTLVVLATLQLGTTIIATASLSYLGMGVPPPHPSWGSMLAEGKTYIARAWWLVTLPGVAIMLTVLASNFLGDWLRVRLDPKYRQL